MIDNSEIIFANVYHFFFSLSLSSADFEDSDVSAFKATVMHDGNVTWVVPMISMSSCQINVQNFPLDEQVSDVTAFLIYFTFEKNGYI